MSNTMTATKAAIVKTVKSAINTPAPRLVEFRHLSTLVDEELDQACYGFAVNGVLFKTGWADSEYYSFIEAHPETSALTIQDLKLLLWWLEQGDTKVNKSTQAKRDLEHKEFTEYMESVGAW